MDVRHRQRVLERKAETVASRGVRTDVVLEESSVPVWRGWLLFFFSTGRSVTEFHGRQLGVLLTKGISQQLVLLETGLLVTGLAIYGNRLKYTGQFEPEDVFQIRRAEELLDALATL